MAARRAPDGRQRRRELCDAGIEFLAELGAKGLSHPRVDRRAGVPNGSASYYFRSRAALIHAIAERIADLDLADLRSVTEAHVDASRQAAVTRLAEVVVKSLTGDGLTRTRARIELLLQASRDPAISAVFHTNSQTYLALHRELAKRSQAPDVDPAAVDDRALLTVMFISGLMLSAAAGSQPAVERDRLEFLLAQISSSRS